MPFKHYMIRVVRGAPRRVRNSCFCLYLGRAPTCKNPISLTIYKVPLPLLTACKNS